MGAFIKRLFLQIFVLNGFIRRKVVPQITKFLSHFKPLEIKTKKIMTLYYTTTDIFG